MKWKFQTAGRLLALLALSGALLAAPLPAQAAPGVLTGLTGTGSKLELELTEMELEITDDDPRPKGYLYTSGQSDYYFIVWMSSNSNVATVDGDGKVTGRNAGTAIITAISDHGERAACKVTVTRKNEEAARKKPTLDTTSLSLVLQYNDLHPTHQLRLTNSDHSFLYVYQWMSSNPEVATVSEKGCCRGEHCSPAAHGGGHNVSGAMTSIAPYTVGADSISARSVRRIAAKFLHTVEISAIIQKPPVSQQTARRCTQRQAVGHTSVKEVRPCVLH